MSTATTALQWEEAELRNHGKRTDKKENWKKKQGNKNKRRGKKNERKTERTEKQDVTITWQPRKPDNLFLFIIMLLQEGHGLCIFFVEHC